MCNALPNGCWCLVLCGMRTFSSEKAILRPDLHRSWDFVTLTCHLLKFLILMLVARTLKPCATSSDVIERWQNINLTWHEISFNASSIQKWRGLAAPIGHSHAAVDELQSMHVIGLLHACTVQSSFGILHSSSRAKHWWMGCSLLYWCTVINADARKEWGGKRQKEEEKRQRKKGRERERKEEREREL